MKKIISIIAIIPFLFLLAAEPDSTKTKSNFRYMKTPKSEKIRSKAIIYSAFLPGAGHFYLDNNKAGWSYVAARLMIIPGIYFMLDGFPMGTGEVVDRTKYDYGRGLIIFSLTAWAADVIHAGISATGLDKPKDENKNLSYGIVTDFEKKTYGLGFTYSFK